jgi:hypothetical protein
MPPVIMGSTSTPDIRPPRRACSRPIAAHLVVPAQVQFDSAGRDLVQQAGYLGFDHHVTARAGRRLDSGVSVGGPAERHHGQAVAAQQTAGLLGGQPAAARVLADRFGLPSLRAVP